MGPPDKLRQRVNFGHALTFGHERRTFYADWCPTVVFVTSDYSSHVSELLMQWNQGDGTARDELIPLVYEELRRLARQYLAKRRRDQTLESAALVHEAYVRLAGRSSIHWRDRTHFFALAARLMRGILVDHVRRREAAKRGGSAISLTLDEAVALPKQTQVDLVALDDALNRLTQLDAQQSQIVQLRFFGGLSIEETAEALGISPATVKRHWVTARAWLRREMKRVVA